MGAAGGGKYIEVKKRLDMGTRLLYVPPMAAGYGFESFSNGAQCQKVDESSHSGSYVSVFIRHFLNKPAQNLGILRKLYQDFGLSSAQIETITDGAWQKETVIDALRANGITRHSTKDFRALYGSRRAYGFRLDNKKERKVIENILSLQKSGKTVWQISTILNSNNVPSPKGKKWHSSTIKALLDREATRVLLTEKTIQTIGFNSC